MDMKNEVVTLKASPIKWILVTVVALAGIGAGVFLLSIPHTQLRALVGWGTIAFCGLCGLVGLLNSIPGASYLTLSPVGFTVCTLWRKQTYQWCDLSTLGVTRIKTGLTGKKMIGLSFREDSPHRLKSESLRKINMGIADYEAALHDDYGMGYEALAKLMNQYLEASRD